MKQPYQLLGDIISRMEVSDVVLTKYLSRSSANAEVLPHGFSQFAQGHTVIIAKGENGIIFMSTVTKVPCSRIIDNPIDCNDIIQLPKHLSHYISTLHHRVFAYKHVKGEENSWKRLQLTEAGENLKIEPNSYGMYDDVRCHVNSSVDSGRLKFIMNGKIVNCQTLIQEGGPDLPEIYRKAHLDALDKLEYNSKKFMLMKGENFASDLGESSNVPNWDDFYDFEPIPKPDILKFCKKGVGDLSPLGEPESTPILPSWCNPQICIAEKEEPFTTGSEVTSETVTDLPKIINSISEIIS